VTALSHCTDPLDVGEVDGLAEPLGDPAAEDEAGMGSVGMGSPVLDEDEDGFGDPDEVGVGVLPPPPPSSHFGAAAATDGRAPVFSRTTAVAARAVTIMTMVIVRTESLRILKRLPWARLFHGLDRSR
jgi:hypothetical protein